MMVVAAVFLVAVSLPVSAETIFNQASESISQWGKCSSKSSAAEKQEAKQASSSMQEERCMYRMNPQGGKEPMQTSMKGDTQVGIR